MATVPHPEKHTTLLDEFKDLVENDCEPETVQDIMKMSKRELLDKFERIKEGTEQELDATTAHNLFLLFERGRTEATDDLSAWDEEISAEDRQYQALRQPTELDFKTAEIVIDHQNRLVRHIGSERAELERIVNTYESAQDADDKAALDKVDAAGIAKLKKFLNGDGASGSQGLDPGAAFRAGDGRN